MSNCCSPKITGVERLLFWFHVHLLKGYHQIDYSKTEELSATNFRIIGYLHIG